MHPLPATAVRVLTQLRRDPRTVALLVVVPVALIGLLASAFARTEFQAVQFMPAIVLPQFLLCGLLLPRSELPDPLHAVSSVLPLSYAIDAMTEVTRRGDPAVAAELLVVVACSAVALAAGAATLRRRTA